MSPLELGPTFDGPLPQAQLDTLSHGHSTKGNLCSTYIQIRIAFDLRYRKNVVFHAIETDPVQNIVLARLHGYSVLDRAIYR